MATCFLSDGDVIGSNFFQFTNLQLTLCSNEVFNGAEAIMVIIIYCVLWMVIFTSHMSTCLHYIQVLGQALCNHGHVTSPSGFQHPYLEDGSKSESQHLLDLFKGLSELLCIMLWILMGIKDYWRKQGVWFSVKALVWASGGPRFHLQKRKSQRCKQREKN
jgi:hypothetical protein